MLTSLIMIILQHIQMWNYYAVYLKLICQLYLNKNKINFLGGKKEAISDPEAMK